MARIQIVMPDEDRERFLAQARKEGLSFSAWLRRAATDRLERQQRSERFAGPADVTAFFAVCDERDQSGAGAEADWPEQLARIEASRASGRGTS